MKVVPTPISETETKIRSLTQEWARLYNEGDFDTLASLYLPDAVVLPPNQRAAPGTAAIRDLFKWFRDAGATSLKVETTRIVQSPELALEMGVYSLSRLMPIGGHTTDRGKYLTTLQRQSTGDWRIVFHCWNSDLPPISVP
jgi:uncharacterized protein (TIGR02246 family)